MTDVDITSNPESYYDKLEKFFQKRGLTKGVEYIQMTKKHLKQIREGGKLSASAKAELSKLMSAIANEIEQDSKKMSLREKIIYSSYEMPEKDFWALIDGLGWDGTNTNWKELKKTIESNITTEEAENLRDTFDRLSAELYDVIDTWLKKEQDKAYEEGRKPARIDLGDDRFDDFLAYIIGLGSAKYNEVKKNPKMAPKLALGDIPESFVYAIPWGSNSLA